MLAFRSGNGRWEWRVDKRYDRPTTPDDLVDHLGRVTDAIAFAPLDDMLEARLNADFPVGGPWYEQALALCCLSCKEGWLHAPPDGGGQTRVSALPATFALIKRRRAT